MYHIFFSHSSVNRHLGCFHVNFCCLKPPHVRYFVRAAPGNSYHGWGSKRSSLMGGASGHEAWTASSGHIWRGDWSPASFIFLCVHVCVPVTHRWSQSYLTHPRRKKCSSVLTDLGLKEVKLNCLLFLMRRKWFGNFNITVALGNHFNMWFWNDPTNVILDEWRWNRINVVFAGFIASLNRSVIDRASSAPSKEGREGQTSYKTNRMKHNMGTRLSAVMWEAWLRVSICKIRGLSDHSAPDPTPLPPSRTFHIFLTQWERNLKDGRYEEVAVKVNWHTQLDFT